MRKMTVGLNILSLDLKVFKAVGSRDTVKGGYDIQFTSLRDVTSKLPVVKDVNRP